MTRLPLIFAALAIFAWLMGHASITILIRQGVLQ